MRAYVQKHHGEFANINTLTAFLGFRDMGYDVRFFEFETIDRLELGADTPVAGGIPVGLAALARLGIIVPELPSIPSMLDLFAGAVFRELRDTISTAHGPSE